MAKLKCNADTNLIRALIGLEEVTGIVQSVALWMLPQVSVQATEIHTNITIVIVHVN